MDGIYTQFEVSTTSSFDDAHSPLKSPMLLDTRFIIYPKISSGTKLPIHHESDILPVS